ncbi:MAG: M3 family oligoendopeptidase [Phycisphaerales bacterium]|nr:M3 family oligoendopeptidase [Phycisphaerales bacterium]
MTGVAEFPRRFVAPEADFGSWAGVQSYYQALLDRSIATAAEFERWLLDWSELDSAFEEEGTSRQIAMTCATDDPEREKRFLDFVENVRPHREPVHHALRQKLVATADRIPLPAKRYEVLLRSMRNSIEIFREENIPLQVEDAKLAQLYQKTTGAMTVEIQGEELTIQQAAKFVEEPDRALREEAWRLISNRYLADSATLDDIYAQMVAVRHQMALNMGLKDYRAYAFKAMERFDYTPDDCLAFHDAIEKVVVPAATALANERRRKLGVETLRPWDMAVDPEGRKPLRPFEKVDRLIEGSSTIFRKVSGDLGAIFDTLRDRKSLDLDSRKGKAPGGYQANYDEKRLPFIFMNAVGTESDVRTLLHEGGHAFHTWSCRSDPLLPYRHYPTEFAEVASMGMECLSLPHLEEFYAGDVNRARKRFFAEIINFLPYMAMVDALQHHVYTSIDALAPARPGEPPKLTTPNTRLERWKDDWQRLRRRFQPWVNMTDLESDDRHSWHRKLHFFEVPFYYVEYGIAQLGALQVWLNAGCPGSRGVDRAKYEQAVAEYRNGLALGGSRPLPELFAAAGLKFDFSEKTLRPLVDAVMEEIGRL